MDTYEVNVNTGYGLGGGFYNFAWTSETPTQEGWYWMGECGVVRVEKVTYPKIYPETVLVVYTAESGCGNEEPETVEYYSKLGMRWLGPLPEPMRPE